jgi:hypothetical protein
MSKKIISKPITIALGTALVGGLTTGAAIAADENPFEIDELTNGQLFAGDGGCGEDKGEGGCGEGEGEGGCGESGDDEGEGGCGEGKCGGAA